MYRLDQDPAELVNLADAHPDVVERLAHELRTWREGGQATISEQDLENMEELRSLGYIDD